MNFFGLFSRTLVDFSLAMHYNKYRMLIMSDRFIEERERLMLAVYEHTNVILRTGDVAIIFICSHRSIRTWCDKGLLRYYVTPGGHRRFRGTDVRALLEGREVS